jgi:hypothetical protein
VPVELHPDVPPVVLGQEDRGGRNHGTAGSCAAARRRTAASPNRSLVSTISSSPWLTDAVLCADGPVRSLVDLTLVAEHRQ